MTHLAPSPAAGGAARRAVFLATTARHLAAAGSGQAALAAAGRIELPRLRGAILASLAPLLTGDVLEAALTQASGLEDAWARGAALAGLLSRLPAARRVAVLVEVLAAARSLDWLAGDVLLRDAAVALAAAGDAPLAGRLFGAIRDDGLRRAALELD